MKKRKKYIFTALIALILIAAVVLNNFINTPPAFDAKKYGNYLSYKDVPEESTIPLDTDKEGYCTVAQSGNILFDFDFSRGVFCLQNTESGFKWLSYVTSDMIPSHDFNKKPLDFIFSAALSNKSNGNTVVINSATADETYYSALKDGVKAEYRFSQYGLNISIEFFLKDGGFFCRIPIKHIKEYGEYSLLNIDLLPFFGASGENEQGYIVYPDGCGALYSLGDIDSGVATVISTAVYSDHVVDVDRLLEKKAKNINSIILPFFGTKRGNDGMTAFITEGDISADIKLSPFGCVYKLNRVYANSVYRRVQPTQSTDGSVTYYDTEKEMRGNDFCVRYALLSGNESDYSGMAREIKRYMISAGRLPEKEKVRYNSYLEFLMGVKSKSLLGNKYEATTTVSDAERILSRILDKDFNSSVSLLGWQKEGYGVYPSTYKPSDKIGGKKGLANISCDFADINLQYGTVLANTTSTGSKIRRDAISSIRGITLMNSEKTDFIMNPVKISEMYSKALDGFSALKPQGILLDGCGEYIYDDYNKSGGITRKQTADVLLDLMHKTTEKNYRLVLRGANSYTWNTASLLTGMPEKASGYAVLTQSVPFIYLVLNGSIPYSLYTAGNCSADFSDTKLKWIEYGAIPYFLLTEESSEKMVGTAADSMFSTKFSDKEKLIKDTFEEFKIINSKIKNSKLISHSIISKDFTLSRYSNGICIYVNCTDEEKEINGIQ